MDTIIGLLDWYTPQPPPVTDPVLAMLGALILLCEIVLPAGMVMYSLSYRGLVGKERPSGHRHLVGCALGLVVGIPFGLGWMPFWAFLACLLATEAANRLKRPRPS